MASTQLKLYCSWFCPFAQRAWIALLEKGVPFEYVEINPYEKSAEFLAINPRGLVPVLVQEEKSVYESSVCIEFIDENWSSDKHLFPEDAWEKARVRIMADYISKRIVPIYYQILQRQIISEQEDAKARLLENLKFINNSLSSNGPYLAGQNFGMADIMFVPFSLRFAILKHYRNFEIPDTKEYEELRSWMSRCHTRESVTSTVAAHERMVAIYERYANNSAKTEVADAIRKGDILP